MRTFLEFLELHEDMRTSGKTGLYPLGYGGIGNYPPAYMINTSADAFVYMDADARFHSALETHPFDISHIPSTDAVKEPKDTTMPGKIIPTKDIGGRSKLKDHGMPGKEIKPKGERMKCVVAKPEVLGPDRTVDNGAEDSICPELWKIPPP